MRKAVQDIGEAVPQGRRCEDVVAILKREILLRQYVPGDVLPREEMLAQRYGVSRAMIREALGVLKANGYLEARRGKHGGTFVKDLLESSKLGDLFGDLILMGKMQIGDLLSARLLIEPEAARLAAMNATRRELQHLADLNEMASIASDKLERTDRNVDFHVAIGQFSGNPFYAISIRSFMSFTRLFVEVVGEPMPYVHDDEAHQRLLQALQAREPQLAFERMYVHVSGMKSAMVSQEQLLRESTLV